MPRYSDPTLRGMLLEEAILYILSKTGYTPIFNKNGDPSLNDGHSGLEVLGRGAKHQIDAVADFLYTPPFSNPHRLLIEAKFKNDTSGIDIVRNAAGVHKDVSEYWVVDNATGARISRKRYHYLYAVFSKENFSKFAQDYAYAQDIFLLPLKRNRLFNPIIEAIENVTFADVETKPKLSDVRKYVRSRLFNGANTEQDNIIDDEEVARTLLATNLTEYVSECTQRGFGFITMFDGKFPVFLSASRDLDSFDFNDINYVRIRVRDNEWFIESEERDLLFTFDLPEEIFEKYEESGSLSRRNLLNIKEQHMSEFYVFSSVSGNLRLIKFRLDRLWFEQVSENLGN